MSRFDYSRSWESHPPALATHYREVERHNHEPFPLTAPQGCPACPQYPEGYRTAGTTADRRLDGAAADAAAQGC
jgi:hypothetical protein